MVRFQDSIEVSAPVSVSFQQWSQFENFPHFMKHVKKITHLENDQWLWEVEGPLGKKLDWIAEVDGHQENRLLSWHSIEESDINIQTGVVFEEINSHSTRIVLTFQYEPSTNAKGILLTEIFNNMQQMLQDDLNNFKRFIERQSAYHTQQHY